MTIKKARLELLTHFHPESTNYAGHPILEVGAAHRFCRELVEEELNYALSYDPVTFRFSQRTINGKPVKFKNKHTVILLRDQLKIWKAEADRLYNGIKDLAD